MCFHQVYMFHVPVSVEGACLRRGCVSPSGGRVPSGVRVSVGGACVCWGCVSPLGVCVPVGVRVSHWGCVSPLGVRVSHRGCVSPLGVHVSIGGACFRQAYVSPLVCVAGAPHGVAAVVRV